MVKRVTHELIDDIDGKPADESIVFALDGAHYEIDLSKRNAKLLREALAPYVAAGSKVSRGALNPRSGAARRGGAPARSNRDQNRGIREWAQSNGIDVSDRGRIKQQIVDRYHAEAGRR